MEPTLAWRGSRSSYTQSLRARKGANFSRNSESGAGIAQAQLQSTSSSEAKGLKGIGLGESDLTGWDFSGQNLTNASPESTTVTNASLTGADLTNVSLSFSTLLHFLRISAN
jgi:uncharacterized protein YjbI with pentapeptide repeats